MLGDAALVGVVEHIEELDAVDDVLRTEINHKALAEKGHFVVADAEAIAAAGKAGPSRHAT